MNSYIYGWVERLGFVRSRPILGQMIAVLLSIAAIETRFAIGEVLTGFPFLTFFPAITLAAFLGGRASGITAAILGALLAKFFLIEPFYSFHVAWPVGWIAILFYALTAAIIVGLMNTVFVALDLRRASEDRLQLALSAGGGVGTWELDVRSGRVFADERFARLYGVDAARAKEGAPLAEFFVRIHPEDRGRVQKAVERAIATGEEFREDYRLVDPDEGIRWVSADGSCTYDADGRPLRFPGVSFDITSRRTVEEKLRLLNIDLERQVVERSSERGTTWQVSPHLLSVISLETGCFSRVNPAWTAVLGWAEDELVGKPFYDFLHPDDVEASRAAWEQVRHGEVVLNFENRYRARNGDTRVLSWVAVPENGRLYSTARDVTAEKALRDSEGQFRTMAQAMPHHVWMAGPEGLLDWFNDRVYAYSGKSAEALAGTGWTQIVHSDDLADAAARWAAALAGGETYETEFRLRRADGAYRWHIARAVPVRDAGGVITRWIGTNTDIEDQRQVQRKLGDAQAELSVLLNSAASAFYSIDRDGATTSCNQAFLRILGFDSLEEVMGKRLHDVIHHSHADGRVYLTTECPIYLCAQNGKEAHIPDEFFYRKDGAAVPVEYWVRPLYRDGLLKGAICNFNDISERKHADEQRGLLLSELNHRVKNLFALVGGIISLSARNAETAKDLAAVLQGRLGALSRAHELIQPGLRGNNLRAPDSADLKGLIGQIFEPYISAHGDGAIIMEGPAIALSGESVTGMALIFHELATNAAKYGALREQVGRIHVTWQNGDGMLTLRWRETGAPPRNAEPQHRGFGSILIRRSIENQFGGTILHQWNDDGLEILITAPLARLSRQ